MHVAQVYTDATLVNDLKQPREMDKALRFMYREYYTLLENYITNNNGSKDDAADIIQETMVAFIEIVEQEKFRGDASVKSFLYSIARNLWLTELRKRGSAENRNKNFEKAKDTTEQATIHHLIHREHFSCNTAIV